MLTINFKSVRETVNIEPFESDQKNHQITWDISEGEANVFLEINYTPSGYSVPTIPSIDGEEGEYKEEFNFDISTISIVSQEDAIGAIICHSLAERVGLVDFIHAETMEDIRNTYLENC